MCVYLYVSYIGINRGIFLTSSELQLMAMTVHTQYIYKHYSINTSLLHHTLSIQTTEIDVKGDIIIDHDLTPTLTLPGTTTDSASHGHISPSAGDIQHHPTRLTLCRVTETSSCPSYEWTFSLSTTPLTTCTFFIILTKKFY